MKLAASSVVSAVAVLLLFVAQGASGKGLTVRPARGEVSVPPGRAGSLRFVVTATGTEPTRARIRVEDFVLDEEGRARRADGISGARSAAGLFIDPVELSVQPGGSETVLVSFRPPEGRSGSFWALLAFDVEAVRIQGPDGREVGVASRLLVPVVFTVGEPTKGSLRLTAAEVTRLPEGVCRVRIELENGGNSALRPAAGLLLFRRWSPGRQEEIARTDGPGFLLLPGAVRRVALDVACGPEKTPGLGVYVFVGSEGSRDRVEQVLALSDR